jgi:hypothetical protein
MPPVDDRTLYRSYQKPNAANTLADDVARLRAALDAIDDDIAPYVKKDVVCATTANITPSGTQTIDGIAVAVGNRVLVKNQTAAAANGVYVVSATAWPRAADMNTASAAANAAVGVRSGTTNGGSIWINNFKSTDTLGTTSMNWVQIGAGGVTSFSAGTTGLTPNTATTGAVTLAGTLGVLNGGTGVTTSTGTGSVVLSASPVLTGTSTFRGTNAIRSEVSSTQDAVVIAGRAGGTNSYSSTITPSTLTASRTLTLPDADGAVTVTKSVLYATTTDLDASSYAAGVLSGYPYNAVVSATSIDGSAVLSLNTSTVRTGRPINVPSIYVPAGLTVSTIDSTSSLTLNSATRTVNATQVVGNGTTATITYSTQTYTPFAVGALVTIAGTGDIELDGPRIVLTCSQTTLTFSSVSANTFTVGVSVSQQITSGTADISFRNLVSALQVDSSTVAVGSRVLVKDQRLLGGFPSLSASYTNGIYVVTTAGSTTAGWVLTRATDANTSANLSLSRVLVSAGAENSGETFYTDFLASSTLDSASVNWYSQVRKQQNSIVAPITGRGVDIDLPGGTVSTANSVSLLTQNAIINKTITAISTQTHSDAATLYIAGAPTAGTNTTITNPWSLYVGTGNGRFDGPLSIGSATTPARLASRGPILTLGTIVPGSFYTDGTYNLVPLVGGSGTLATATITVLGGNVTSVVLSREGNWYKSGDVLSATSVVGGFGNGTGSGFSITVATVREASISIYHPTSARIRLASANINSSAGGEYGSIVFNSGDISAGGNGDRVRIVGVGEGTAGGGALQIWTCPNLGEPAVAARFNGDNSLTLFNSASTFSHTFSSNATANRTITIPDESFTLGAAIPAGTVMLFVQTNAPTGWTKDTTSHNNKALRVVTGTASSGGTSAFTTVFASRTPTGTVGATTLTTAQIPGHTHPTSSAGYNFLLYQSGGSASFLSGTGGFTLQTAATGANTGGGGSHTHSFTGTALDFAVQYVDVIIATKN